MNIGHILPPIFIYIETTANVMTRGGGTRICITQSLEKMR